TMRIPRSTATIRVGPMSASSLVQTVSRATEKQRPLPSGIKGQHCCNARLAGNNRGQEALRSTCSASQKHEATKESGKPGLGVEREHVGNILVGAYDDRAAPFAIDPAQVENVGVVSVVRAEHFLEVAQRVSAFGG